MNGITISLITYVITIIISFLIAAIIKLIVVTLEKFAKPEDDEESEQTAALPKDDTEIAIAIAAAKQKQS
ncbi:MAG TPA: hypothetical protein PLO89_12700 [Spirochaetota bacterium]|nr:hypothetical protein [Spirochaetota bacterium]